jgi:hypothetical protein
MLQRELLSISEGANDEGTNSPMSDYLKKSNKVNSLQMLLLPKS